MQMQQVAGVPERYRGLTLSSLAARAAEVLSGAKARRFAGVIAEVEDWFFVRKDRWALVLYGPPGTGKTSLGAALIDLLEPGFHVPGFITASDCVNGLRDPDSPLRHSLDECTFLVVDDLGSEYATYFSNQAIDDLVARRYAMGRPTVLTTNLDAKALSEYYTGRLVDRLREGGVWIDLTGLDSFRGQQ